jgi:uracil-DNA glycosylase family 4
MKFNERVSACTKCTGCSPTLRLDKKVISRTSLGFAGTAQVLILGEAPGKTEYNMGIPFVGKSGNLLQLYIDDYLPDISWYITNTIKCWPVDNKDPSLEQKGNCLEYLQFQFAKLNPDFIVTLGKHAKISLGLLDLSSFTGEIISLYHPAYLLYNGSPDHLTQQYRDGFQKIRDYYGT